MRHVVQSVEACDNNIHQATHNKHAEEIRVNYTDLENAYQSIQI